MPLVVVGHGAEPSLLHRQAGLGAVERLDLALLVDRQHDGVSRRIDIEADDVAQLVDELGIVGELELAPAVGLQPVRLPDATHSACADASRLRHHVGGPVRRLARQLGKRQRHHALGHLGSERRNAREGRVLSRNSPSKPSVAKRSCQRHTQVFDLPVCRTISTVPVPLTLSRMISARQTCFCGVLRSRMSAVSRWRSVGER